MSNILGIGNTTLDILLTTDHYPKEDEELRAHSRRFQVGGNIGNSLYVLAQLGHQTAIASSIASDDAAKQITKGLQSHGIGTEHLQRYIQGSTPTSYVVVNQETGSRTITHYRDLAELSFEYFAKIEIEHFDWLHFEGRNVSALKGMLNIAKTFLTDQPISLEVEKAREEIESLFGSANVLFFSHHYAREKGYASAEECLNAVRPLCPNAQIICTWGKAGVWFAKPGGNIEHQPAFEIPQTLDTLGAGDTFNAAVIDALLRKMSLAEAVKAGARLAARKCQQYGLDDLLTEIKDRTPLANIQQVNNSKSLVVPCPDIGHSVILVKLDNEVKAYINNCPHQDVPLNEAYKIDVNPFEKTLKCSVHDAWFNISDGECVEGPCLNESLQPVDIDIDDKGDIYYAKANQTIG